MFAGMNYGVYFMFAALSFLAIFFAFFLIPETRGIPLEASDRLFEIKPVWKAHKILKAQLKEDEAQFRVEIKQGGFGKEENEAHAHVENGLEAGAHAETTSKIAAG
ncbi:hypothetical protein PISL3812_09503 [Talaromyces islandicus]|uniref:Major facilitator superfamily (MFS) profile domain-containing protein n=1 Tax=Talaromyces islandicus TaxID=28573 RepID=A0A0U1M9W7_TALIS|nr:hypothetical protein PISL3812_09503 [Talaromyces islandicus]